MAEKIEAIEAEAEANNELAGELQGDSLSQRFKALEAKRTPADMALAELKAKMGLQLPATGGGGQKALPKKDEAADVEAKKAALSAKGSSSDDE